MAQFENITLKKVSQPQLDCSNRPVLLSDETMKERYEKVMQRMNEEKIDTLVIYADLEHGNNFEYLTGFLPRFEEALLVMNQNGNHYMLMGNENLNKVPNARIQATAIHAPYFSLPNQPMGSHESLSQLLLQSEIAANKRVGIVGWKNFTSSKENNAQLFDVPSYIVDEVRNIVGNDGEVFNATYIFIGNKGVRCINNVNEIEHYEFGAALASDSMLKAMNKLDVNVSEMEIGAELNALGQKNSVVTIAASGKRFVKANIYPTDNKVKVGDPISLTIGYKGGLSSRAGYAIENETQLPQEQQDYLEKVVKPYFNAYVTWLGNIHCGMKGNDLYQLIEKVLPKEVYHWTLCPGHLTADEEWMSSPVYNGSEEIIESGMLFQVDIIPSVKGYAGVSAESSVAIANEKLRNEIAEKAPELWKRIQSRKEYLEKELNITLHPDVLPMCSTVAYLRPYLLNKETAMTVK